jgi:hypothetical protein
LAASARPAARQAAGGYDAITGFVATGALDVSDSRRNEGLRTAPKLT